jgi:hypothetical protein
LFILAVALIVADLLINLLFMKEMASPATTTQSLHPGLVFVR